jgi:hypothetical protein
MVAFKYPNAVTIVGWFLKKVRTIIVIDTRMLRTEYWRARNLKNLKTHLPFFALESELR